MDCEERVGMPRVGSICPECAALARDIDRPDLFEGSAERHLLSR